MGSMRDVPSNSPKPSFFPPASLPPECVQTELNQKFGSFLGGVDLFDAPAMGVSPAEALLMDPQQRLVMQCFSGAAQHFPTNVDRHDSGPRHSSCTKPSLNDVSPLPAHTLCPMPAEALSSHLAHHEPSRATGVYVGVSQLEYARISLESGPAALNTYYATGAHLSIASGRLSYTYGLKGPAMTVDTACSSSLVTTHLAAKVRGKSRRLADHMELLHTCLPVRLRSCLTPPLFPTLPRRAWSAANARRRAAWASI